MFNPHCAVIAAFERKYRKYLLIVSVIEAEELLSLLVAFMDLKDLLALTTSCRQMQSLLHVPFIELRILRAKVKCLGNFTHSQRYNTEEVEEDEKMTIYSHPQILLNVKPKCFKGLIQQLKALNNSRKKQEIKQSVAIPPETTNNDLPPPKLAEPSRKNFKSKYTQQTPQMAHQMAMQAKMDAFHRRQLRIYHQQLSYNQLKQDRKPKQRHFYEDIQKQGNPGRLQIKEEYPPEESNKEQQQIKKFHKLRLATQGELIEFFLKEKQAQSKTKSEITNIQAKVFNFVGRVFPFPIF